MSRRFASVAVARIVLENRTALAISTGHSRSVFDSELVTDWNGLPMIPGSSLAGVLRSLCVESNPDGRDWFGYQDGDGGVASAVHVSHGLLHSSKGQVLEFLDLEGDVGDDEVWRRCRELSQTPSYRHGVRLNHRGVVDGDGKYDIAILAPGHRFTAELRAYGDTGEAADQRLDAVLAALVHPRFALGRRTRSGLGRFNLHAVCRKCLREQELSDLDPRLSVAPKDFKPYKPKATPALGYSVRASVDGGWLRVGGGARALSKSADDEADVFPYSEECVVWQGIEASHETRAVLPGSAIRGPLRHRTLFHLRCLQGRFADQASANDADPATQAVDWLFGSAKNDGSGAAGLLHFEDLVLPSGSWSAHVRTRTSIDRFTGGVRHGLLFTEEQLFLTGELAFDIVMDAARWDQIDDDTRRAFERALRDLTEGLLPIGAGGTNGLGALVGRYEAKECSHAAG